MLENPPADATPLRDKLPTRKPPQPEGHMASHIERRKFLATLGGAAAAVRSRRAQQQPLPVIGYLNFGSPESG